MTIESFEEKLKNLLVDFKGVRDMPAYDDWFIVDLTSHYKDKLAVVVVRINDMTVDDKYVVRSTTFEGCFLSILGKINKRIKDSK